MGPNLIFDKSILQSLSPTEALWMDSLYTTNITPLYYVETLADLEKKGRSAKDGQPATTPEEEVGKLASKTPKLHEVTNVFHESMIYNELCHGVTPAGDTRPFPAHGKLVQSGEEKGVIFDSPEADAMARWHKGEFDALEREYAQQWRTSLNKIDLQTMEKHFLPIVQQFQRPSSRQEALIVAQQILTHPFQTQWNVRSVMEQHLAPHLVKEALARWSSEGARPIPAFAPYTAYEPMGTCYADPSCFCQWSSF